MRQLTDSDLEQLLLDPRLGFWIAIGMGKVLGVDVDELLRLSRERHGERDDLQGQLDAYVNSIGGERHEVDINLDDVRRRIWRRLRGRSNPPPQPIYTIPVRFFTDRDVKPRIGGVAADAASVARGARVVGVVGASLPVSVCLAAFVWWRRRN
jgi:hypothetical protein